jgi:hypothetical protein
MSLAGSRCARRWSAVSGASSDAANVARPSSGVQLQPRRERLPSLPCAAASEGPQQQPQQPDSAAVSITNLRFRRQQEEGPVQPQPEVPITYVDEFPAELEGLSINDAGILVDEKTGKVTGHQRLAA